MLIAKFKILCKVIKFLGKVNRTAHNPRLKDGGTAKNKIALYGFWGRNLGDDLFFDTLLKRYPDTVFVVYDAPGYEDFFDKYNNVYCYQRNDPHVMMVDRVGRHFKCNDAFEKLLLKKCDAVVHIGGSVYQQIFDWQTDMRMRQKRYNKKRPFFSISANFGPHFSDDYRLFWHKMFERSYDICFRDKYSYNMFSDVKAVRYAPDLLFTQPLPDTDTIKGRLFVSVIEPSLSDQSFSDELCKGYTDTFIYVITKWLQAGNSVCFSSFCALQQDSVAIDKIINAVPENLRKNICIESYDQSRGFENVLLAIAQSEYVLATRFHAILLGLCSSKPVLPICYSQKVTHMLEDICFDGAYYTMDSLCKTNAQTVYEQLLNQKPFDVTKQQQEALGQFGKLDNLISKSGGKIIA